MGVGKMKKKTVKQKPTTDKNVYSNIVFINFKTGIRFANYKSWSAWVQLKKAE